MCLFLTRVLRRRITMHNSIGRVDVDIIGFDRTQIIFQNRGARISNSRKED